MRVLLSYNGRRVSCELPNVWCTPRELNGIAIRALELKNVVYVDMLHEGESFWTLSRYFALLLDLGVSDEALIDVRTPLDLEDEQVRYCLSVLHNAHMATDAMRHQAESLQWTIDYKRKRDAENQRQR